MQLTVLGELGAGTGRLWPAVGGGAAYGGWMLLAALVVSDGYGLGDVKLAAAVGVWLGGLSWHLVACAALFGQLFIVASLLAVRYRSRRRGEVGGHAPLGPALVAGAALA